MKIRVTTDHLVVTDAIEHLPPGEYVRGTILDLDAEGAEIACANGWGEIVESEIPDATSEKSDSSEN